MSSTAEVKDAIRMAQQYNIHIYKCLINGLVDSSLTATKLRAELEDYTRSTMKFFDCLYQIRDSKIPFDRIREEQINAFRDHLKKNDYLRQEVHKVQRNLWNLREMGQRLPKANKHMIIQEFPELCVSTRPDNVPFTVLCDHIIHKYNLRDERPIMDMLRWADEQSIARRTANRDPNSTVVPIPNSKGNDPSAVGTEEHGITAVTSCEEVDEANKDQPVEGQAKVHDVTPVMSWEDLNASDNDQPPKEGVDTRDPFKSWVFVSLNSVPPTSVLLADLEESAKKITANVSQLICVDNSNSEPAEKIDETIKRTQANMQKEEEVEYADCNIEESDINNMFTTEMMTATENVEDTQIAILSFADMTSDCFLQETNKTLMPEYSYHQKKMEEEMINDFTIMEENISSPETPKSIFVRESMSEDDVMSVFQNIPEIDYQYTKNVPANFQYTHTENMFVPSAMTRLKAEIPDTTKAPQQKDDGDQYRELQYQNRYNPRSRKVLAWEELIKRFTKSSEPTTSTADTNVSKVNNAVKPSVPDDTTAQTDRNGDQAPVVPPVCLNDVSMLPDIHPNLVVSTNKDLGHKMDSSSAGDLSGKPPAPVTEIGRSSTKIKEIQQLVGCDRPHVYENKIKRRQHTPKNNTEYMTAAEVLEYHKKREEQLQELEVKKMRTKSILNQQFSKNNCKTAVHYFKLQNIPKVNKVGKVRPTTAPTQYRPPLTKATSNIVSCLTNQTSRKRPATSSGMSSLHAVKRPRRPRIILRIFKEETDWNVEQVIDRD